MTEEQIEEVTVWRFTIADGKVKTIGPHKPLKPTEIVHTDEDATEFMRIPMPDSVLVYRIKQAVCAQYGEDVSGKGYYHEESALLEFAPEKS